MAINLLHLLGAALGVPQAAEAAPVATGAPVQASPLPVPPGVTAPAGGAVAAPEPDIQVTNNHIPPPNLRQGIVHGGLFGLGHTGGNILGILGDAFLTQAGHAPQYAPRLQQAREAEALQDFQTDPVGALQKYGMINPQDMLHQTDVMHDNQRQQAAADSVIADNTQNRYLKTRGVLAGMANAAANSKDPSKVWPTMLDQMKRYAEANGFTDPLPDSPETAGTWAAGSQSVSDQEKDRAMAAWRAAQEDLRQQAINNRKAYGDRRLQQIDRGLGYQGQRTDHTVNAAPTPTQISGQLAAKVAAGQQLTANEQKTWDMLHPKKGGGAGKINIVRDANGNITAITR